MSFAGSKKTMLLALFVIPAAIFLFYFFLGSREAQKAGQAEQIPQTYLQAGASAEVNGGTYRAGTGGYEIAFYSIFKAGNNQIMPEPGFIFAAVPILVPSSAEGPQPDRDWTLLDDTGQVFKPLTTDPERLSNLRRLTEQDLLPSTRPDYLIFKVKTEGQVFYLKLQTADRTLFWRLTGSKH